jgi:hypothetical protein
VEPQDLRDMGKARLPKSPVVSWRHVPSLDTTVKVKPRQQCFSLSAARNLLDGNKVNETYQATNGCPKSC